MRRHSSALSLKSGLKSRIVLGAPSERSWNMAEGSFVRGAVAEGRESSDVHLSN